VQDVKESKMTSGERFRTARSVLGAAVIAALSIGGVASTAGAATVVEPPAVALPGDLLATSQIIVGYDDGAAPNIADLSRDAGETVTLRRTTSSGAKVLKFGGRRSGADVAAVARRWAARPGVKYAEPDLLLHPTAVPTDPEYVNQWDLSAPTTAVVGTTLVGANLTPAWDVTTGTSDVVVAVVDTGITAHADLAGQVLPGYDFITDAQIGNDGTGRDSNPSDPGDWITATQNSAGFFAGCGVSDSSWHGTHVAGTVAAVSNNGIGVAGIAPGAKILPIRVLGKCGGFTSDIVDGMRWAAGLAVAGVPANPNPAAVLNLSLGGGGACSVTQQQAIDDITAVGATVVVAAGNSNVDVAGASPGNCANVVTVAATGSTGSRAYYSNFGSLVEISAPGGDVQLTPGAILSTLNAGITVPTTDTYVGYQGTSMATPHVAGVAALVKSVKPSVSPAELLGLLQSTSATFPARSTCTTLLCGSGMLDAGAAVSAAAVSGPQVVGSFSKAAPIAGATAQATTVTLQWTPATGAAGYEYCLVAGLTTPCTSWTSTGLATSATVSGLTGPTLYSWQVRAVNGTAVAQANVSLRSTFTTATPVAAPGAFNKTSPTSAQTGVSVAPTLSWGASTGATSYEYCVDLIVNSLCDGTWTSTGTLRTAALSGLVNSTAYEWQVRARNSGGVTSANVGVSWRFTTVALPLPGAFNKTSPANAVTGRALSLSLAWAASTRAVSYEVCVDTVNNSVCDGTWSNRGTSRTVTVTGLTSRTTYYWQVRAVNAGGITNANAGTWWRFTTA